jgi:hypothetical protein
MDDQEEADLGQAEMDEVREQRAEERETAQAELDAEVARRRAEERKELATQEAANYARHHAIIERDEEGNPIEKTEQE